MPATPNPSVFNPPPESPVTPDHPRGLYGTWYKELGTKDGNSPLDTYTRDDTESSRRLKVYWNDRHLAAYKLLGYPQRVADGSGGWKISRYLPDYVVERPYMVPCKVRVERGLVPMGRYYDPFDSERHIQQFMYARLLVDYDFPPYEIKRDDEIASEFERFVEPKQQLSGDYLSIPNGTLAWNEGDSFNPKGRAFESNTGFTHTTTDYHWIWYDVPYLSLPLDTIKATLGKTNKTTFADKAPGELLFLGADIQRKNTPYGERSWRVEYVAKHSSKGHNNFYYRTPLGATAPGGSGSGGSSVGSGASGGAPLSPRAGWFQISIDGVHYAAGSVPDGKLVYDEIEFANLFKSA